MNEKTAEGKFDQIKGKVKQGIGETVGNDRLANSGAADQVKGAAKESWGTAKDAFRDSTTPSTTRADDTDRTTDTAHDVRQKVVSTAQNVKDDVKEKTEHFRRSA